jgi:hypothetical protein
MGAAIAPIRLEAADCNQLHFAFWLVGYGTPAKGRRCSASSLVRFRGRFFMCHDSHCLVLYLVVRTIPNDFDRVLVIREASRITHIKRKRSAL